MRWRNIGAMNCSVARTLELVGDRWTMLIVHEAFLGVHRFEQFTEQLGVARNILTVRLQALVRHGILDRVLYQERPARYEYRLTDRGRDLHGVVCLLREWGDKWLPGKDGPSTVMHHTVCGRSLVPVLICAHCQSPAEYGNTRTVSRPAMRPVDEPALAPVPALGLGTPRPPQRQVVPDSEAPPRRTAVS